MIPQRKGLSMKRVTQALIAALVGLALVVPASTSAVDRQIALGVSMADNQNIDAVDAFTASVGRAPAIWAVWSSFGDGDSAFPTAFMQQLQARGIVPMVNWQPVGANPDDCSLWSLDNILRGDFDAYIREWATAARDYGGRVIVRFAHEMNGYWFIWGDGRCTNTPSKFRQAWRHVWDIFKGPDGVGATNVKFLWSILGPRRAAKFYPGATYVDYTGISAFNWGPSNPRVSRPWRSLKYIVRKVMPVLNLLGKPVIIGEMGVPYEPGCSTCDKAAWITAGYNKMYTKWPRIVGMVYFNLDMTFAAQPDWRLDVPPGAMDAYRSIVADPRFQGALP
jgi:hypothetical protein